MHIACILLSKIKDSLVLIRLVGPGCAKLIE